MDWIHKIEEVCLITPSVEVEVVDFWKFYKLQQCYYDSIMAILQCHAQTVHKLVWMVCQWYLCSISSMLHVCSYREKIAVGEMKLPVVWDQQVAHLSSHCKSGKFVFFAVPCYVKKLTRYTRTNISPISISPTSEKASEKLKRGIKAYSEFIRGMIMLLFTFFESDALHITSLGWMPNYYG